MQEFRRGLLAIMALWSLLILLGYERRTRRHI